MSTPKLPKKMDKSFQQEIISLLNTQLGDCDNANHQDELASIKDIDEEIGKAWKFNPSTDDIRQRILYVYNQQSYRKISNVNGPSISSNSPETKEALVQGKTKENSLSEVKEITCTVCNMTFDNHDIYRAHMRKHTLMLKRSDDL